jgi:hypothetical protein
MLIDVKIALGLEGNVDERVTGKLLNHVIEEAHTRGDVISAGPVEIDGSADLGLFGAAIDRRAARIG